MNKIKKLPDKIYVNLRVNHMDETNTSYIIRMNRWKIKVKER